VVIKTSFCIIINSVLEYFLSAVYKFDIYCTTDEYRNKKAANTSSTKGYFLPIGNARMITFGKPEILKCFQWNTSTKNNIGFKKSKFRF